jgi:hypothetical protein
MLLCDVIIRHGDVIERRSDVIACRFCRPAEYNTSTRIESNDLLLRSLLVIISLKSAITLISVLGQKRAF